MAIISSLSIHQLRMKRKCMKGIYGCKGYTFMKDAICIITDLNRLDICLEKEVYPLIAKKYAITGTDTVEHGIRNALKSAEFKTNLLMPRPTNKLFLLMAAQEVNARLLKELIV